MTKVKEHNEKNKKHKPEATLDSPSTNGLENGHADVRQKMSRKDFEKEVLKLQVELVKLQEWVKATGAKVMVVFEGRDTAGKGGVIKAITARTSPRVFRTVALSAPT